MIRTMIDHNSPLGRLRQRQRVSSRDAAQKSSRTTKRRWRLSSEEERILRHVMTEEMDYIDSEEFRKPDAEQRIYDQAPAVQKPDVSWYRPLMDDPTPARNQSTKKTSTLLLTAAEERVLFLQYNYARHRIAELQREIGSTEPTEEQAKEILRWYRVAQSYREQIAETNLALVLAMAKRTRMSEVDFADLVSEGNMALLRSVDKFDCDRGFKFSTYACRAILKAFSRQGMKLSKYRQRFPTDFDPSMEKSNHLETLRRTHEEECADEVKHIVETNEAELSDVERTVIQHRFGLGAKDDAPPLTLEQVGQIIGVTKERVRQIQNKALEKIRAILEENVAETSIQEMLEEASHHPSPN
ncbi:MAG: sigma-70 family RNA polymerase sigma factor [Phycisphaerales bacterium]|nr:MAG: sigma-70 family RNA polymerase sigma factor [Phycisphaerales bacterium]